MGQFLIVLGEAPPAVRAVFDDGCRLFNSLSRLQPNDRMIRDTLAVATFPPLKAPSLGIVREPGTGGWLVSAGGWFYERQFREDAAHLLLREAERVGRAPAKALEGIDGLFAIAMQSGEADEMLIVTDRLGSLHVYYTEIGGALAISTSSLVLAALAQPGWDMSSCREFLATGTVFDDRSLFEGIRKIPAATVTHFRKDGRRREECYWNLADFLYDKAERQGTVDSISAALLESIETIGRHFRRPSLDLTGGFDSRIVFAAAVKNGLEFETTVTGRPQEPDVVLSKRIAGLYSVPHHHHNTEEFGPTAAWRLVPEALALTDGEYDVVDYARTLWVHQRSAEICDGSVNGSNGEICKGYWWELLFPFTGRRGHFDPERIAAARFAFAGERRGLLAADFDTSLSEWFAGVISRTIRGLEDHPNTALLDSVYLRMRMQRWQGRITSATSRIWPCLSPFTFRAPLEMALGAPPASRVRNRMSRRLLETLDPRLALIPLDTGCPAKPLRLVTAHEFAPALIRFAWKRWRRRRRSAERQPHWLWKIPEIGALLRPAEMATREIYTKAGLAAALEPGPRQIDAAGLQRMLTLELVGRAVRSGSTPAP